MSVYPPKMSPSPTSRKSYMTTIKPTFIPPRPSLGSQELSQIRDIKHATQSLVRELWEAGRDQDPTSSYLQPIVPPFVDPVKELEELNKVRLNLKLD
jgi:hypothetical protein